MENVKLIIDAIALPFSIIVTIAIIKRNLRNITNFLIGLTTFTGGVVSLVFALLKEIYYEINLDLSLIFAKLTVLTMFFMIIPVMSFTIFFWKVKYPKLPNFLHGISILLAIAFAIWLFIVPDSITLVDTDFGINNFLTYRSLIVYSVVVLIIVFTLFLITLRYMAKNAYNFPQLKRRMNYFTVIFVGGFGSSFLSLFVFQYIFQDIMQPFGFFVLLTAILLTLSVSGTLIRQESKLWHGCPKLVNGNGNGNGNGKLCFNTDDGVPIEVKLLDIGNIIERIQVDIDVLKTGEENCCNIVFSDEKGLVHCLTTHKIIEILGESVTRIEMDLAKEMEILEGRELCSDCIYKIIAYRKEHKSKSDSEIRNIFLGIKAEEFFGLS